MSRRGRQLRYLTDPDPDADILPLDWDDPFAFFTADLYVPPADRVVWAHHVDHATSDEVDPARRLDLVLDQRVLRNRKAAAEWAERRLRGSLQPHSHDTELQQLLRPMTPVRLAAVNEPVTSPTEGIRWHELGKMLLLADGEELAARYGVVWVPYCEVGSRP